MGQTLKKENESLQIKMKQPKKIHQVILSSRVESSDSPVQWMQNMFG